jgi:hypothetical protein
MDVPGGERLPPFDIAGQGVVLGIGTGLTAVVDDPAEAGPGRHGAVETTTEGEQDEVARRAGEAGRLPLAVDGADAVVQLVLVPVEVVPAALDPRPDEGRELATQPVGHVVDPGEDRGCTVRIATATLG